MPEYPQRSRYFAHRYCRLLVRTCAAQEIGAPACVLCVTIAHLEDSKRYTGPVTFHNEQLMPLLGTNRFKTLASWRRKAVDAGWLHYIPGGRRGVGKYWVTIPPQYTDLPDTPIDEGDFPCVENVPTAAAGEQEEIGAKRPQPEAPAAQSAHKGAHNSAHKGAHSSILGPNPDTHGPRSVDQKCGEHKTRGGAEHKTPAIVLQASDLGQAAATIFNGCGYRGNQGGNLWKVAALLESGIVSEGEVASACRGAKLNGRDKPAHFYTCLKESLTKRGEDLGALLKGVRIEPQWPKSPPAGGEASVRLKRVQDQPEHKTEELLRKLAECTQEDQP